MNQLFDPDSWIMTKLSALADLMIINLLYLLTSIPIITIGASTTALYSVMKTADENAASSSMVKNYFHSFFSNFKKSTLIFLLLLIPAALVAVDLFILFAGLLGDSILSYILCGIPAVVFLCIWSYVFALYAKFENTIKNTLSNAFLLSVAYFPTTILVIVANLLPLAVFLFFTEFFYKTLILWILLGCSLPAKVNSLLLKRVFDRCTPKKDLPETA